MVVTHAYIGNVVYQRFQHLAVFCITIVVYIFHTDGNTQIDAVVDVAGEVEVILTDVARLGTVELIAFRIIGIHDTILDYHLVIEVVHLALTIAGIQVATNALDTGLPVLRRTINGAGCCRQHMIEITTLVEVNTKVHITMHACAGGEYCTQLVERSIGLRTILKGLAFALRYQSKGAGYLRTPEETDTSRVGTHGREVGS